MINQNQPRAIVCTPKRPVATRAAWGVFVCLYFGALAGCNQQSVAADPPVKDSAAKPAAAPPPAAAGGPPGGFPTPEVAVVTVESKARPIVYEYAGQAAGSRETEVRARVAGVVQKRLYEEGAVVKAGSTLFVLDAANFQTQASSTDASVAVAQARVNQSRRDNDRLKPLIAENAVSQKEFDDSKASLETALATLRQTQAQAQEARLNLGYTKVTAPISGVAGTAAKSDGSLVSAADSLLTTIIQTDPIFVNFSISENDLLKLDKLAAAGQLNVPGGKASNGSLGFTATVKLADGSVYPRVGKLNFTSAKVNPQTGSLEARAVIPNPDGKLRPGQFLRVELGGATRPNTVSVPQRSVIDSPFGKIVFKVTPDNKLAPQPVELDGWSNGEWIVTKGVVAGDRVVADGFIKANKPGMLVKPVPFVAKPMGANGPPSAAQSSPSSPPATTVAPPAASAPAASAPATAPASK